LQHTVLIPNGHITYTAHTVSLLFKHTSYIYVENYEVKDQYKPLFVLQLQGVLWKWYEHGKLLKITL